jgi:hypothetical protein
MRIDGGQIQAVWFIFWLASYGAFDKIFAQKSWSGY